MRERFIVLLLISSFAVQAQETLPSVQTPVSDRNNDKEQERRIEQAPLDAIVFFNPDGKRTTYLPAGWSLNVLDDFWKYLQIGSGSQPPFVVHNVSVEGKFVENRIEAAVKICVKIASLPANGTLWIPIALKEGILPENAKVTVEGGHWSVQLAADTKNTGYALIARTLPKDGTTAAHPLATAELTATFPLWLPVRNNALSVSFPPATASHCRLQVPGSAGGEVSEGALLTTTVSADKKTTELNIKSANTGLRNKTDIRWFTADNAALNRPLVVEKALYDYTLTAGMLRCNVTLPVSQVRPNRQFHIRLPAGAVLDRQSAGQSADYDIGEVNSERVAEITPLQDVPSVVLKLTFTIDNQQPVDGQKNFLEKFPPKNWTLEPVDIPEAKRQSGLLAVSIPAGINATWDSNRSVQQVAPRAVAPKAFALFEFNGSFVFPVCVSAAKTRINVKPEYLYQINTEFLRLTANISYTISGSEVSQVQIVLPGNWNYDAGPPGIVNTAAVERDENGFITIPLRQPTGGTFDIQLKAYQLLPPRQTGEKSVLSLAIPQALGTWNEPASVVFAGANKVEIQPVKESGLMRQNRRTLLTKIPLPDGLQNEPLFYLCRPTGGTFSANVIEHQQKINAVMTTDIYLDDAVPFASQTLSCDVSYIPADTLYFDVPKSIEKNGGVQIRCGSKLLDWNDAEMYPEDEEPEIDDWMVDEELWSVPNTADEKQLKVVRLPDTLFKFQLTIRYPIQGPSLGEGVTGLLTQSFVLPQDMTISEHQVNVHTRNGGRVELADGGVIDKSGWQAMTDSAGTAAYSAQTVAGAKAATFRSDKNPDKIALKIMPVDQGAAGISVKRNWLQTWFNGNSRQDRLSYLLTTGLEQIRLQLPAGAGSGKIFVRLDGEPAEFTNMANVLTVAVPQNKRQTECKLDVEYRFDYVLPGTAFEVQLPAILNGSTAVDVMTFWQLIVPPQKHLLHITPNWLLEFRWKWKNFGFRRIPALTKQSAGFEADPPLVSAAIEQSNQYLLSGIGSASLTVVTLVNRSSLVGVSSAAALCIGLLLIYVPQSRYAGSLLLLTVALLAVFFYRPAPAVLCLQMSVFGVCLTLLALFLRRIFGDNRAIIPASAAEWSEPTLIPVVPKEANSSEPIDLAEVH